MKDWKGISGYHYKNGENSIERLRNKLSTVFLAIEASKCEEDIIKDAVSVLPDIIMHLEDAEDYFRKNDKYNREGEEYTTNEGCKLKIVKYFNSQNCTIKFDDGTIKENIKFSLITRGKIKNSNHKSVQGVGYFGQGKYNFTNNKECYKVWEGIIKRGYSNEYNNRNSYKDVTVCKEWHNFQNFAEWFYTKSNYQKGLELDKDLLIPGNKIYSPETCYFVHPEINTIFHGLEKESGQLPLGVKKLKNGRYSSKIKINSKSIHLGNYETIEEAHKEYTIAKESRVKELALRYFKL